MNSSKRLNLNLLIARHFIANRAVEVLALQASPIIGLVLSGESLSYSTSSQAWLLVFGSLALTSHIFLLNDLVEYKYDIHDLKRINIFSTEHKNDKRSAWIVAISLLIVALFSFSIIGNFTLLLGSLIALLGLFYSCVPGLGKQTAIIGSLNHFLGGSLHFLLGYTFFHNLDLNGVLISLFFGFVFAAGHLNQEVRDYQADLLNGIRTNAVTFGRLKTFNSSLALFSAAYATLCGLAILGIMPKILLSSILLWLLHIRFHLCALQDELTFDTALWMQRRYRLLFAIIGITILFATIIQTKY